jgi:hypothetical protein
LANKLQAIATTLELGSHRDDSIHPETSDNKKKLSIEQEAFRLNQLNEEWVESLNKVRLLKGFEDFLRPSRLSSLRSAASEHPVIILLANDDGSHCLIMTSTILHHIPLPTLRTAVLKHLVHLVRVAISNSLSLRSSFIEETRKTIVELLGEERASRPSVRFRQAKLRSSDDIFTSVLRVLWDELVKPVIDFLDIKVRQDAGAKYLLTKNYFRNRVK